MNKSIALPVGALAIASITYFAASTPNAAAQGPAVSGPFNSAALRVSLTGPIQVAGIPTPQQMRHVLEGAPFTVPAGKIYVCTGIAAETNGDNPSLRLSLDGVSLLEFRPSKRIDGAGSVSGYGPSIGEIPPGLAAQAGTIVSVSSNSQAGGGIVFGYLADA